MKRPVMQVMVVFLLIGITYGGSIGNGFVWDDLPIVVANRLFDGSHGVLDLLRAEDSHREFQQSTGYYRPLTYLTFYADNLIWGKSPAGFHATNLLLHALVALVLYALLSSLLAGQWLPLAATLLFAVNPVTVEPVCFIAGGRNTILCALFVLLALLTHRKGHSLLAAACTFAAVAAKEFGLLVPLLLLCHDTIYEQKTRGRGVYLVHLLPIAILLAARSLVVAPGGAMLPVTFSSVMLVPELVLRYLAIILLPFLHRVAYSIAVPGLLSPRFFAAVAGCGLLAVLAFVFRAKRRFLFGISWFLLFLLPALLVSMQYKFQMADRHAYLPAIGLVLALSSLLDGYESRVPRLMAAVLIAGFALLSFSGSGVWKNNGTLFMRMTEDAPRLDAGYTGLGQYYLDAGNIDRALFWIDRGESAGAVPAPIAMNIRLNMLTGHGESLNRAGQAKEAERAFRRALQLNQEFVPAIIDLGSLLAQQGDPDGAIRFFRRAAELQPGNPVPHFNLSEVYRMRRDMQSAEKALHEYRRLGGETR